MNEVVKNKKPLIAYVLTAAVGIGAVGNVDQVTAGFSESNTQDVDFHASVANNCKLSDPVTVAFGAYDPVDINATAPLDTNGAFDIRCSKGGSGDISISNGDNYSAPNRRMKKTGSSDFLNYQLYTTAGRTTVWDDVNIIVYGPAETGARVTREVYGRIPGAQINAVAGSYLDTVVITVSY